MLTRHLQGWFAVRREKKLLMAGFLFLNAFYIVGWSAMFKAQVYTWTFIEWPFFGCTTIVSFMVLVGALVFGIICWTGFDQGLSHYRAIPARSLARSVANKICDHSTR